jgi:hypothetical protein
MSWGTFKSTLLPLMQNNAYGNSFAGFAAAFTQAYDVAIKSGGDVANNVPLLKGNTILMQQTLIGILQQTQTSNSTTLLEIIGPAIIVYWTGGLLSQVPPPKVPAPGAIKNISTVTALVLNPGSWTVNKVEPNNNPEQFLDAFINSAKIHLNTVSGLFNVIAQYPPPAPPAPGVVPWSGYKV